MQHIKLQSSACLNQVTSLNKAKDWPGAVKNSSARLTDRFLEIEIVAFHSGSLKDKRYEKKDLGHSGFKLRKTRENQPSQIRRRECWTFFLFNHQKVEHRTVKEKWFSPENRRVVIQTRFKGVVKEGDGKANREEEGGV